MRSVSHLRLRAVQVISISAEGKWAVGIIAAIVDVFAMMQFLEWRKM